MSSGGIVPFDRYPGLSPLFPRFLAGLPDFYPDPPTLDAAVARGRELLGKPARTPASAFRCRGEAAARSAAELAAGRAVAVVTGHQVGLFGGPLFTITKAFDVIRTASEITRRGVPAVPVFWALTDDHDLEEVARTAWPGRDGPEVLVLEGADRANRKPVGGLPLPQRVSEILDTFAAEARGPDAEEILATFRRRYAPGTTYADAFIETLLDWTGEGLLVLDPYQAPLREATAEFFREAARRKDAIQEALARVSAKLEGAGLPLPVPFRPGVFPFFTVADGERRRVDSVEDAVARVLRGDAWPSPDVLTRPVLKSWLMPAAASILGPAEIAYHAQALALFPIFDRKPPVLLPRSFVIPLGPPARKKMEALGISREALFLPARESAPAEIPGVPGVAKAAEGAERELAALEPELKALDPTLVGALENTRSKVAYQFEQLQERMKKAAKKKGKVADDRRQRLDAMLLPQGAPAERLYPALVPLLAYGRGALDAVRDAARGSLEGAAIVDLGLDGEAVGGTDGR
ncbi:MAG: bacillithiol biosynthesis cysteine-adding enzyme BshC [Acidobacteriota bacterium]|nr:bacillithiol biosynthesis cysteine-adding enzyme BshC [Acidobacteriota bacterium]MDQ2980182.1 bacillithiol biosynthesis cysteine-adding enzyme BshC [Acidobacteriota bacterium]